MRKVKAVLVGGGGEEPAAACCRKLGTSPRRLSNSR